MDIRENEGDDDDKMNDDRINIIEEDEKNIKKKKNKKKKFNPLDYYLTNEQFSSIFPINKMIKPINKTTQSINKTTQSINKSVITSYFIPIKKPERNPINKQIVKKPLNQSNIEQYFSRKPYPKGTIILNQKRKLADLNEKEEKITEEPHIILDIIEEKVKEDIEKDIIKNIIKEEDIEKEEIKKEDIEEEEIKKEKEDIEEEKKIKEEKIKEEIKKEEEEIIKKKIKNSVSIFPSIILPIIEKELFQFNTNNNIIFSNDSENYIDDLVIYFSIYIFPSLNISVETFNQIYKRVIYLYNNLNITSFDQYEQIIKRCVYLIIERIDTNYFTKDESMNDQIFINKERYSYFDSLLDKLITIDEKYMYPYEIINFIKTIDDNVFGSFPSIISILSLKEELKKTIKQKKQFNTIFKDCLMYFEFIMVTLKSIEYQLASINVKYTNIIHELLNKMLDINSTFLIKTILLCLKVYTKNNIIKKPLSTIFSPFFLSPNIIKIYPCYLQIQFINNHTRNRIYSFYNLSTNFSYSTNLTVSDSSLILLEIHDIIFSSIINKKDFMINYSIKNINQFISDYKDKLSIKVSLYSETIRNALSKLKDSSKYAYKALLNKVRDEYYPTMNESEILEILNREEIIETIVIYPLKSFSGFQLIEFKLGYNLFIINDIYSFDLQNNLFQLIVFNEYLSKKHSSIYIAKF